MGPAPPLTVDRPYFALARPIQVQLTPPPGIAADAEFELAVLDGVDATTLALSPVSPGLVRVGERFPVLWTLPESRVLHLQAYADGKAIGPSLVLRPLVQPPASGPPPRRGATPPHPPPLGGYHVAPDRDLVLRTNLGDLRFRLREDQAPTTTRTFADLASQGMLDETSIYRIVPQGLDAPPLIVQGGDPTATGRGGPGFAIDFEPSPLPHRFGTLALAHEPTRPDSGGSQFFICVADAGCPQFNGVYTAFGELIDGAGALDAIATTPTRPNDPDDPRSPRETPVTAITVQIAELVPAAPHGEGPPPVTTADIPPVSR